MQIKCMNIDSPVVVSIISLLWEKAIAEQSGAGCPTVSKCSAESTGINLPDADESAGDGRAYNLQGLKVDARYKGMIMKNAKKLMRK